MRSVRLLVIFTLCLTVGANAQFGRKLKDMANRAKKATGVERSEDGTREAKATNVRRGHSGTREVNNATADIAKITAGETKDVILTVSDGDANGFRGASNNCISVDQVTPMSGKQVKVKITANADATDGMCQITLENREGDSINAEIDVKHKPKPGENFRAEQVSLEQAFAPSWTLKLPGGTTETLKRGKQMPDGGYEYKDSKGKWYHSMYVGQALMLSGSYGNECSYQGQVNSKGEGLFYALSNACGVAAMAPIEANSK